MALGHWDLCPFNLAAEAAESQLMEVGEGSTRKWYLAEGRSLFFLSVPEPSLIACFASRPRNNPRKRPASLQTTPCHAGPVRLNLQSAFVCLGGALRAMQLGARWACRWKISGISLDSLHNGPEMTGVLFAK